MSEGYNGYANYETWELCLELDNDQYLQSEAMEKAREFYLDHGGEENDEGELVQPLDEDAIYGAADDMEAWVDEMVGDDLPNFIVRTAVTTFLQAVNWEEVVEKFLEE